MILNDTSDFRNHNIIMKNGKSTVHSMNGKKKWIYILRFAFKNFKRAFKITFNSVIKVILKI